MVHNDWCRANGYPVRDYKPQAGRPKLQAPSFKPQAPKFSSVKPTSSNLSAIASSFKL